MTAKELLQQCKDEFAKDWIKKHQNFTYTGPDAWHQMRLAGGSVAVALEKSAEVAIDKARDEAAPKWIDAAEELPEPQYEFKSRALLGVVSNLPIGVVVVFYDYNYNQWWTYRGDLATVTHWMKIPEVPKKKAP